MPTPTKLHRTSNDENKMISGTTARGGKVYPKVRCRSCVREWNARYRQAVR